MYRHILIPTYGLELAEHAVTNGLPLAKSLGAKVAVITVEDTSDCHIVPETRVSQRALDVFEKRREQVRKQTANVLDRAVDAAKEARCALRHDAGGERTALYSDHWGAADKACDLIALASHGCGGLSALVLGKVTNKILTHTQTPVLVCH
jgi:nucleotide-binding universal stress UspA family protein